jgi:hypothetical protein
MTDENCLVLTPVWTIGLCAQWEGLRAGMSVSTLCRAFAGLQG